MKNLLAFLTIFDWTVLPRVIVQTLFHADWAGAQKKHGAAGIGIEALSSLAATNTYTFYVPLDGPWAGAQIASLLRAKGIKMWGTAYANGEMFFRVRRQQAAWAQYVMLQAGVPLNHRLIAGEPSGRAAGQPARSGAQATTRPSPRPHRSAADRLLDFIESL